MSQLVEVCSSIHINPNAVSSVTLHGDKLCKVVMTNGDYFVVGGSLADVLARIYKAEHSRTARHVPLQRGCGCRNGCKAWDCSNI